MEYQVDAVEGLPGPDFLVPGKIELPAAAPVEFGKHPGFAHLARGGRELLGDPEIAVVIAEHVDARVVQKLVIAHEAAAGDGLCGE
jgi:hypothetical protein